MPKIISWLYIFVLLLPGISWSETPKEVENCIVSKCVNKYFACNPKNNKDCKPELNRQQKEVLELYRFCKRTSKTSCNHPGISNQLLFKIDIVQQRFDQCKHTCYQEKAPDLYNSVWNKK